MRSFFNNIYGHTQIYSIPCTCSRKHSVDTALLYLYSQHICVNVACMVSCVEGEGSAANALRSTNFRMNDDAEDDDGDEEQGEC